MYGFRLAIKKTFSVVIVHDDISTNILQFAKYYKERIVWHFNRKKSHWILRSSISLDHFLIAQTVITITILLTK